MTIWLRSRRPFRKLKPLGYLTSYWHRGRYYTLREIARFDDHGLWSQAEVWCSRFGTLLATAEAFVNRSPRGYFAQELARALHVEVQNALRQLAQQRRVTREIVSGLYLYSATDRAIQRGQLLTRRTVDVVTTVADAIFPLAGLHPLRKRRLKGGCGQDCPLFSQPPSFGKTT